MYEFCDFANKKEKTEAIHTRFGFLFFYQSTKSEHP